MAQKVHIVLVDDLDGGDADETLDFSIDGTDYEIDLSTRNAAALREALAPFVQAGRKLGKRKNGKKRVTNGGVDATAVREWARANGIAVSERGRVSADVIAQYEASQQ